MSIQLGSAYGKVSLDVKGLLSAVKSGKLGLTELSAVGLQVGQTMQNVGKTLTIGLTLPIAALGAASIKLASDFEETKNKAVVVFGDMSDEIVASSNEAARALGVSKTQYLDYASSVGAALTAGGMGIKEATELSEQAVKHFADLASFHNTQVEDASMAWQSAIRGQFEPIQKYFPFITQQYLLTYGTANGLIDANTKQLTANQRAVILNAIALDENLNPALNDFAETSGGLANQQRILKAQFQDMLVMLGQNLLPIALKVATALNSLLEKFNNMSPAAQKAVIGIGVFLAALGPLLSFAGTVISFISSIGGLVTTLGGLGISFAGIGAAASAAGAAIVSFLGAALAIIGPILLIVGAIALLYWAFKTNFGGIRTTAEQLWFIIKWGFRQMWEALQEGTAKALENLKNAWDKWVEDNQETFKRWGEWIRNAWQNILDFFKRARDYIVDTFRRVDWTQVGKMVLWGIVNGMLLGIPAMVAAGVKAASALKASFDKSLDLRSPSGAFRKRGVQSWQGYLQGWQQMDANAVARAMALPMNQVNNMGGMTITQNFSTGLSIREARRVVAENNEQMLSGLEAALGAY